MALRRRLTNTTAMPASSTPWIKRPRAATWTLHLNEYQRNNTVYTLETLIKWLESKYAGRY